MTSKLRATIASFARFEQPRTRTTIDITSGKLGGPVAIERRNGQLYDRRFAADDQATADAPDYVLGRVIAKGER